MDVKGANPFLFTDDDYTSPNSANSNPFLMGGDDFMDGAGGDNPFLSQAATTVQSSNNTNPFAFDPMDLGPNEALPAEITSSFQTNFGNTNTFIDTTTNIEAATNMFTATTTQVPDFLSNSIANIPIIAPQKPMDLELKYTTAMHNEGHNNFEDFNQEMHSQPNGPPRPPPPRPPPSKETQDLLMSVMGAMDATSSHLLDRIPPTRTPSPVSMRDLHSPSPTPEPQTQDLLDVSDSSVTAQPVKVEEKKSSHTEDLLMMGQENDINQNPPLMNQTMMQGNQSMPFTSQDQSMMGHVQPQLMHQSPPSNQVPYMGNQQIPGQQPVMPSQLPMMPGQAPMMPSQPPVISNQTTTTYGQQTMQGQQTMHGQPPTIPSHAPYIPSYAPSIPSQAPSIPSQPPSIPSQSPSIPSQSPSIPSQSPSIPSQSPSIPSQAPPIPSHAPSIPTHAPTMPGHPPIIPNQHTMMMNQTDPNIPVAHVPPQRPGPPVRPPRPIPPQKPPPPAFGAAPPAQEATLTGSNHQSPTNYAPPPGPVNGAPPPKPPPPAVNRTSPPQIPPHAQQPQPQQQQQPQQQSQSPPKSQPQGMDDFDMFGMESTPAQKPIASTADIMNLYNAAVVTKAEPQVADLLFDSIETTMVSELPADEQKTAEQTPSSDAFGTSDSLHETTPSSSVVTEISAEPLNAEAFATTPIAQDNFISPEPSQADLQMDTSDSQSKGSVSSVTFNPFAPAEESVLASPGKQDGFQNDGLQQDGFQQDGFQQDGFQQDGFQQDGFLQDSLQQDGFQQGGIQQGGFGQDDLQQGFHQDSQQGFGQDGFGKAYQQDTTGFGDAQAFQQTNINAYKDSSVLDNKVYQPEPMPNIFGTTAQPGDDFGFGFGEEKKTGDDFDAFAAKFESAAKDENKNGVFDPFSGGGGDGGGGALEGGNAWGNETDSGFGDNSGGFGDASTGFGGDESFDAFLAMREPPAVPQSTPNRLNTAGSQDSDEDKDFSVFIKPKSNEPSYGDSILPVLAPPPVQQAAFTDSSPRFNPFDNSAEHAAVPAGPDIGLPLGGPELTRTDSQETPPTPLFDDDVSQPLEVFPRTQFPGEGWEMQLRQPNKKKITGQRFWKKIFVKLVHQTDCVLLQLFNLPTDKDPFQELPLQPCYSVSEIGAQQYDNFGKIFTLKLQYIFYKERPGVRPGQVKKAERITNKLSQFAAYAIQGDYQGVKEFGSDLKKLGLPVEHAPQVSQLMKLGSLNYEDLKQFSVSIEEALFTLQAHRDRALHYKMEEVQVTAVDELYVEQDSEGHVEKQIARVRLFFLGFLTGMPDIELGVNDMRRQGKEVVGRHDIIPVVTEEWIRLEAVEFHSCVQQDEYENTHIIKFKPPDACYIELLRFRVRPPKNRELPLQLKPTIVITGNKVELRADVLVPGFASRKLGQVPCEDVMIRFPIPECWIYMFRVEKHFRYGSVKSAHRRTGKVKGIERFLGTVDTLQESLIEVTSGQAKYEHQHRAIVWRCPRLPKEGQGAYTTHNMVCRLALTSYDQMPDQLAEYCYVEFTMPATQASHTTVRSVSLQNSDSDEPPEKYVRYLARHEYKVGIEHAEGEGPGAYVTATFTKPAPVKEEPPKPIPEAEESSSDSD